MQAFAVGALNACAVNHFAFPIGRDLNTCEEREGSA